MVEKTILKTYDLDPESPEMIEQLIAADPEHPLGHLIEMSRLYWLDVYTRYDNSLKKKFLVKAKETLKIGRNYASDNEGDLDAQFYLGMIELGIARHHIDNGRWFKSLMKVRPGLKRLQKILDEKPDYHDVKQPVGLAHCYIANTPGYLQSFIRLLSFKGDFDLGLQLLEECKAKGFITKFESMVYLTDVAYELKKDNEAAREHMTALVELFPNNIFFQRELGVFEQLTGRNDQAITRYEGMLEFPDFDKYLRISYDIHTRLGQAYLSRGKMEKALAIANACLTKMENVEAEGAIRSQTWLLLVKGGALRKLGKLDEAKAAYSQIKKKANERAFETARNALKEIKEQEEL
ncbi:hypothetical protein MLD52_05120 [Puniceicoccaceae bacterium K14]|nr:hypothetical protein [Puniceicoccaceae bacterium K14]